MPNAILEHEDKCTISMNLAMALECEFNLTEIRYKYLNTILLHVHNH